MNNYTSDIAFTPAVKSIPAQVSEQSAFHKPEQLAVLWKSGRDDAPERRRIQEPKLG